MKTDERFWAKVEKTDDCWLWVGNFNKDGYGLVRRDNKRHYAHRHVLWLAGIDISGHHVDHVCHNPPCVNPDHLRCVTPKQNNENRAGAQVNSDSGIRGVHWDKFAKSWYAQVNHNRQRHFKRFAELDDAAEWVRRKRLELFTHSDMDRVA